MLSRPRRTPFQKTQEEGESGGPRPSLDEELGDFAKGAATPREHADVVNRGRHFGHRVRRTGGEADSFDRPEVVDVVADVSQLLETEAVPLGELLERGRLVVGA